jgi:hypothetical protein
MSQDRLDGLKALLSRYHAATARPSYARGLLTPHDGLGELDVAYAALEEDGVLVRTDSGGQLVMDEFGQRHLRPQFVVR